MSDLGRGESPSALIDDPDLEAVAQLEMQVEATIDGAPVFVTSAIDVKGHVEPVIIAGDEPMGVDELAVAQDTLDAIGAGVGDQVRLDLGDGPTPMRVTGVVALPVSTDGGSSTVGVFLGNAAASALRTSVQCEGDSSCYRNIAVALTDDADLDQVVARYEDPERNIAVDLPSPPGEVERLTAVRRLPWYLAGFLALLAAVTVTYSAAVAVRRRGRDLAVLRAMGMSAAQLRGVVAVQVLALTIAGGALGVVLGLLTGRQVWRWVASSLALPFSPALPLSAIVLVPAAALLITQASATFSRRAAGRVQPAIALRTE